MDNVQKKPISFLAPTYWPFWLGVGLLRLLILLPLTWQLRLGSWLGRFLPRFASKNHRTAAINLKLCFPELSDQQQQKLLQECSESIGMAVLETAMGWWASNKQLDKIPASISGLEHLETALKQGKGVMLCSPHFVTLELTGRIFARRVPIAVMYRPQKKAFMEYINRRALEQHYKKIIPRQDIRGMLRGLKQNEIIWYAPDIDAGIKNSVFVPFFGVSAASITATSRYASMSQAAVIPAFFYRRTDHSGYDIVLEPALENFPSDNLEQDALRINQIFERAIAVHPEQYLWQYKRFKTRPAGEKRFY